MLQPDGCVTDVIRRLHSLKVGQPRLGSMSVMAIYQQIDGRNGVASREKERFAVSGS